ncbi:MAG: phage portal protein [Bacteroidetes bacterium]|nr:phage portal protein [Bacteroidota bacterium]
MKLRDLIPTPFRKSKSQDAPAENVSSPKIGVYYQSRYQTDLPTFDRNASNGYENNSLIAGAISFWQFTFPQAKFRVSVEDKKQTDPYPQIRELLQNPNPEQSESDFKLSIITNLSIGGETFILGGRNANQYGKVVVQLWNYHSGLMQPKYDERGFLSGYKYRNPMRPGDNRDYGVNDVIHLKWPSRSAYNSNKGVSPIQQVFNEINIDTEAGRAQYAYLKNDLMRGKIARVKDGTEAPAPEDRKAIKEDVIKQTTGDTRGNMIFLEGIEGIDSFSGTFDELNTEAISREAEARVARVFGIPLVVLEWPAGLRNATLQNMKEGDKRFNTRTFGPLLDMISETLTNGFKNRFGFKGDYQIVLDRSSMEAFRELQQDWGRYNLEMYKGGAITLDELRLELGLDPVSDNVITSRLRDNIEGVRELRVAMNNYALGANEKFGMTREQCIAFAITLGFTPAEAEKFFPANMPAPPPAVDEQGNIVPPLAGTITVRENA